MYLIGVKESAMRGKKKSMKKPGKKMPAFMKAKMDAKKSCGNKSKKKK